MKEDAGEDTHLHPTHHRRTWRYSAQHARSHPLEHVKVLHCRVVRHGVVVYSIRAHLHCLRYDVVLQGSKV